MKKKMIRHITAVGYSEAHMYNVQYIIYINPYIHVPEQSVQYRVPG